jgi:galactokinase
VTLVSPVRQATSLFQERFGSRPPALFSAPGRVNLLGEHTDYNGGPVLPMAIERRTVVAAGHAEGWEVGSTLDPVLHRIDPELIESGSWTAYVTGVIRVLQRSGFPLRGARLAVASRVPTGAGLSSSAALTVATARALVALSGRRIAPARVAEIAYQAEHDEVGVRCGRMDQTVSALARAGHALLLETATGSVTHVPLQGKVWVIETGVVHRLTGGHLNERRQECETALRMVQDHGYRIDHLAQLEAGDLAHLLRVLPAPWGPRVRHVVTEVARTRAAARALAARDLAALGALLVEGHESLRRDFLSSCSEADCLVQAAVRHGALGARLTGAGWGGAVVALLPPAAEARIIAEVQEQFRQAFGRVPNAWATRAAAGARSEK